MKLRLINLSPRITENVDYRFSVFIVTATDTLDMDRADLLWVFIKTIIMGGARKVVIDMKDLIFIDSIGIGVIINSAKLLRSQEGDIILINVPVTIENIFKPVNLNRFIKIFSTEQDAVNYFRLT